MGCFGAANEKGMLLKTYFALLFLLVILELSIGIAAYGKRDTVYLFLTEVGDLVEHAWYKDADSNSPLVLSVEKYVRMLAKLVQLLRICKRH